MNLLIDIGNSRTKLAIIQTNKIVSVKTYTSISVSNLNTVFEEFTEIQNGILSSVRDTSGDIITFLSKQLKSYIVLDENTSLPFKNKYQTKNTLGKDRIASLAGAYNKYPGKNVLVIDAGTAITYDILNDIGEFRKGSISPGLEMRFKALHEFTGKLPKLKPKNSMQKFGTDTNSAILAGVQQGILFEIEAYIAEFKNIYYQGEIIITGGDAVFFASKLKKHIFVDQNLTLIGLNYILEYNVHK